MPAIELISKLRHHHLVSAIGHCFEYSFDDSTVSSVFLVFTYVPNGTLRSWISGKQINGDSCYLLGYLGFGISYMRISLLTSCMATEGLFCQLPNILCIIFKQMLTVLSGREASTKAYLGSAHSSCDGGSKGHAVPSYRNCAWPFFQ